MSSETSILQSIIQAVNTRDTSRSGPWRTETVAVGTDDGLKIIKRHISIGYISRYCNLGASLHATFFSELNAFIDGRVVGLDISAFINSISMDNIQAGIKGIGPKDISGILRLFFRSESNLLSFIKGHNFSFNDMSTSLVVVDHQNILGAIRAWHKDNYDARGIIRGWYYNHWPDNPLGGGLTAFIQPYKEIDFAAILHTVQPRNISAYLKVWPYKELSVDIQGYALLDLSARIRIYIKNISNISAVVCGYLPINLSSMILAENSGYLDLSSYIHVLQIPINLSASMKYVYRISSNLSSFVECLPIYLLSGSITGWADRSLSARITTHKPPGWLNAILIQKGGYKNLAASILGLLSVTTLKNLGVSIFGEFEHFNLTSSLQVIEPKYLSATITEDGSESLSAYIKVKEIIFNELYKFSTINTSDLRAFIGFSLCTLRTPRSAYASLLASTCSVPTYNLTASIEGIKTIFHGSKFLGVFINYTNKHSMISKFLSFKYSMSVSEEVRINPMFFKDVLNITFKVINGQQDLKTYITSEPHNSFLSATIYPRLLIIHGSGTAKVLTEELVEIDGSRHVWSEYVDVYLRTEKPIYYSTGKVFAEEYEAPIVSFSFNRVSNLGLNYDYDLSHEVFFTSTDEAIRYGFSKITGRTNFIGLTASIASNIKHLNLVSTINCIEKSVLYLDFPRIYLKSGFVSFMGTCVNSMSYKSKLSVFGGIQDMASSVSALPH